jgi:hypothetical protein|tara:strand:+ start:952 stop:1242 length:291 start_codon:yes stop_codon:yes gene_type:complete
MKIKQLESIYGKVDQNDPLESEVLIQGYGRLKMSQLQRDISEMLGELHTMSKSNDPYDFRTIQSYLKRSTLNAKLDALVDAYDDVAKNNKFKRKFS